MRVELEGFVRYDQSLLWRIGDAYYANRGIAAWTEGELPFESTNSAAFARQHAEFFTGLPHGRGPLYLLEIGSGLGRFAPAFLHALREECGARGRKLAERVRFVVSDLGERSVREAIATRALRDLVASGEVIPALFDLRQPTLRGLDGDPLDVPLSMVLANYVCDVTPVSVFRKDGARFEEKYVRVTIEADGDGPAQGVLERSTDPELLKTAQVEVAWREVDLDARLPVDQAEALRALVAPLDRATVPWFGAFLGLVAGLVPSIRSGGVLVINDYGDAAARDLEGDEDVLGRHYGNSLSHPVNLAMLDPFCRRIGLHALRTLDPFRSLNTAVVVYGRRTEAHDDAFQRAFVAQRPCEDLIDFTAAARTAHLDGERMVALRLYVRALAVDPRSVELHFRVGEACLVAHRPAAAFDYLSAGQALDVEGRWDFAFHLGRACHRLKRHADAEAWYRRSLQREDHPATRFDLALVYRDLGDFARAAAECGEALRLRPDYERAAKLLAEMQAARSPSA